MSRFDPQFPIPDGFYCVRCKGKHLYCGDCGGDCVCPSDNLGEGLVCEHDRGALQPYAAKLDPKIPFILGLLDGHLRTIAINATGSIDDRAIKRIARDAADAHGDLVNLRELLLKGDGVSKQ